MPRTSAQNQEIKAKRKSEIVNASLKMYATHGYKALRIDMITAEAKCSHGLFYHYFKDKKGCLIGIHEEYLSKLDSLPPINLAYSLGGIRGLKVIFDYVENLYKADENEIYAFQIINDINSETSAPSQVRSWAEEYDLRKALVYLLNQGQQSNEIIAGDINLIADTLIELINLNLIKAINKNKKVLPADLYLAFALKR